jgi:hypothetical protein
MIDKLLSYFGGTVLLCLLTFSGVAQAEAFGNSGDAIRVYRNLFLGKGAGTPWTDVPEHWGGPRCSGIDLAPSFSTALSKSMPLSDNPENPVLPTRRTFRATDYFDNLEVADGCAGGFGQRYLIRFSGAAMNLGSENLAIGNPLDTIPDLPGGQCSNNHPYCGLFFVFGAHLDHLHSDMYDYRLIDANTNQVVITKKIGIGTVDTSPLGQDSPPPNFAGYPTENGDGISSGWADDYPWNLPCQYVDVTDIPPGNYRLELTIDQGNKIAECDESNNVISVDVQVLPQTPDNYAHDQGAAATNVIFRMFGL